MQSKYRKQTRKISASSVQGALYLSALLIIFYLPNSAFAETTDFILSVNHFIEEERFTKCKADLSTADANGDQKLDADEYLEFVRIQSSGRIQSNELKDLPLNLVMLFVYTSCKCAYLQPFVEESDCCVRENAYIKAVDDGSPECEAYLVEFCSDMATYLDDLLPVTPRPTLAPVTQQPSPRPSTAAPILAAPTASPTDTLSTSSPTLLPTTPSPTSFPTAAPSSISQTASPTDEPTTASPTLLPTTPSPTSSPTAAPSSIAPTASSTDEPTTAKATLLPTTPSPTSSPTAAQSSIAPTASPTDEPTIASPTLLPTTPSPTSSPTAASSTVAPTVSPIDQPTLSPVEAPVTPFPTTSPTQVPSTSAPTLLPTNRPTTEMPTLAPSPIPSVPPINEPSFTPTSVPSPGPTLPPSAAPVMSTMEPTAAPTIQGQIGISIVYAVTNNKGLNAEAVMNEDNNTLKCGLISATRSVVIDTLNVTFPRAFARGKLAINPSYIPVKKINDWRSRSSETRNSGSERSRRGDGRKESRALQVAQGVLAQSLLTAVQGGRIAPKVFMQRVAGMDMIQMINTSLQNSMDTFEMNQSDGGKTKDVRIRALRELNRRLVYYTDEVPVIVTQILDNPSCPSTGTETANCLIVFSTVYVIMEENDNEAAVREAVLVGMKASFEDESFLEAIPDPCFYENES